MPKFKVNAEGVQAIEQCQRALKNAVEEAKEAADRLLSALGSNEEGAGPSYDQIMDLANRVKQTAESADEPAGEVCESLGDLAESYNEIIAAGIR